MTAGEGGKLGRKQEAAIAGLLAHSTLAEAAAAAGIAERTLKNWLQLPEFQKAYAVARQDLLSRTVGRLLATCEKAVATLERNLSAGKPGEQTRAAVAVLTLAVRGVETLELAERLAAVEARLATQGKTP